MGHNNNGLKADARRKSIQITQLLYRFSTICSDAVAQAVQTISMTLFEGIENAPSASQNDALAINSRDNHWHSVQPGVDRCDESRFRFTAIFMGASAD